MSNTTAILTSAGRITRDRATPKPQNAMRRVWQENQRLHLISKGITMEPELEVIAERSLTFDLDGTEKSVRVQIGRPYAESDGAYFCPYRVVGLAPEGTRRAGGADGIQALQLALVMIGAELSSSSKSLKWDGEPSTGFPASIHDSVLGPE